MTKLLSACFMILAALPALAQDAAIADESTPDADAASATAETAEAAEAAKAAETGNEPFVPPPGFKTKKQGDMTLYCKKDAAVGTRFKTEKCYSEDQVREYLLALEIQKRDIDRIRSTCATGAVCAPQ
jgi:invasion protein IalB